jgi:BirA family biotin operon repressor/biotin-[acetyl-CoA-carboxylase] ligase
MRTVHIHVTDSTNTQARALAADYPGERLMVTAAEQTAGRGRLGRAWQSPRGGAWMSLVWPLSHQSKDNAEVAVVAAEAVLRALRQVAPERAGDFRIKWPNDILIDDRKAAGILCEQCAISSDPRQTVLIIGVGVNVDFDVALLGDDLRQAAITLSAAVGRPIAVADVVAVVSQSLVEAMTKFESPSLEERG